MSYQIEEIKVEQDADLCHIIRTVGTEFGAVGEGFGPSDAEVAAMSQHYSSAHRSVYLVACVDGSVAGGCGIARFNDSDEVCELRKLFLLPAYRGLGIGQALTKRCLDYARNWGYRQCYLDSVSNMTAATGLYEKLGFEHLEHPLQGSIHNRCDVWMMKTL